jgi:hypothetical protein
MLRQETKVSNYPITGKHSLHQESNENGMRFIQFATAREVVIGSTLFPSMNVHKVTWKSPQMEKHTTKFIMS